MEVPASRPGSRPCASRRKIPPHSLERKIAFRAEVTVDSFGNSTGGLNFGRGAALQRQDPGLVLQEDEALGRGLGRQRAVGLGVDAVEADGAVLPAPETTVLGR